MFEKFGEFNSADDMNTIAATMLEEGKTDDILALAKENGIDEDDAKDFIDGIAGELCTPLMAAVGKLKIEAAAVKLPTMMEGYVFVINDMATYDKDLQAGIRKTSKKLVNVLGELLKESSKNRVALPKEITTAAGIKTTVYVGDVDRTTFKKIVRKYYTEG